MSTLKIEFNQAFPSSCQLDIIHGLKDLGMSFNRVSGSGDLIPYIFYGSLENIKLGVRNDDSVYCDLTNLLADVTKKRIKHIDFIEIHLFIERKRKNEN